MHVCALCMRACEHARVRIHLYGVFVFGVLSVGVCIQSVLHAVHVLYFWLASLDPCVLCLMSKSYESMRKTYDNEIAPWRTAFYMSDLGKTVF